MIVKYKVVWIELLMKMQSTHFVERCVVSFVFTHLSFEKKKYLKIKSFDTRSRLFVFTLHCAPRYASKSC